MDSLKRPKNFILFFLISFGIFLALSIPFRANLAIANVSDVRITAVLNPVLGLAFGWPAALGCAAGNFIADMYSNYGLTVSLISFIPQVIYGILPFYLWSFFSPYASHRTRLDSPKKVLHFALLMAINSVPIAIFVGIMQFWVANSGFLSTIIFVFLNDFAACMVFGLPLMALLDFIYSKIVHKGKRNLSLNEKIILISSFFQIAAFNIIVVACYRFYPRFNPGPSFEELWSSIFSISSIFILVIILISVVIMFYIYNHRQLGLRVYRRNRGDVFVDTAKTLEFVSFAAPSLENKVKADFWGYTDENIRKKQQQPSFETAWYTMISNQKGCPMACVFCDCPSFGFKGNVSRAEFNYQIATILTDNPVTETKYFEVDFMRMGEPTLNHDILDFIEFDLRKLVNSLVDAEVIYPYVSTMLPKAKSKVTEFILDFCRIKNEVYKGNAAIQFSINTTDETIRNEIFQNRSMSLSEIAEIAKQMPLPLGRKYALNFAVTKDSVIDAALIDSLFDKEKFLIKITPIHETFNAVDNGFKITSEYDEFDVFRGFEDSFKKLGWDVLIYLDTKEEDDDALTCGNLLLSNE